MLHGHAECHLGEQLAYTVSGEFIQGMAYGRVVQIPRRKRCVKKALDGFAFEKLRGKIQAAVGKPKAVENQCNRRLAGTDDPVFVYNKLGINSFRDSKVLAYGGDKAMMIERKCLDVIGREFKHGHPFGHSLETELFPSGMENVGARAGK